MLENNKEAEEEEEEEENTTLTQTDDFMSEDEAVNFFVQSGEEGLQWKGSSGLLRSSFDIPKPNCCHFYPEINFGGYKIEVCYDLHTKEAKTYDSRPA